MGAAERCLIPGILRLLANVDFQLNKDGKKANLLTTLTLLTCSAVDSLCLCKDQHQRIVIFSTWEADMAAMEIAFLADPCEALFHIHHFL